MFNKISFVRKRYEDAHLRMDGQRRPIVDQNGQQVGFIDVVQYDRGALRVSGWVRGAKTVVLKFAGLTRAMSPDLARIDVGQDGGMAARVGFDLTLKCSVAQMRAEVAPGLMFEGCEEGRAVDPISMQLGVTWASLVWVNIKFAMQMLWAAPLGLRWVRRRAPQDRVAVLDALGIGLDGRSETIADNLFDEARDGPAPPNSPVTIIVPVHNGFEFLEPCLDCVMRNTDVTFRLILVEDASPDPRVRPFLRDWVDRHATTKVTLIENIENLGFIGSVNTALRAACDPSRPKHSNGGDEGPVILLNTDAFVPDKWASRLIAPMRGNDTIASTTPMSNDAELMSVPAICRNGSIAPGTAELIDDVARQLNPSIAWASVPTGVGFCMALSRKWLAAVPRLDPTFGRGYGEEVDWCQRVRAKGGIHIGVGTLFVEHRGGASFGATQKADLIARNGGVISRRYPAFDGEVQAFIAQDPLMSARLALAMAWAGRAARSSVQVYVAHSLGGGAEDDLRSRMMDDLARVGAAIVLRVGGPHEWRVEVHSPYGVVKGDTDTLDVVFALLRQVGGFDLVYSCGVGAVDPARLPDKMRKMHKIGAGRFVVLIHDFFMVSPSYTLLGSDGRYCGPNLTATTDPAHEWRGRDDVAVPLETWQENWYRCLRAADRIDVFSENSGAILRQVWPDLGRRICLRPHETVIDIAKVAAPEFADVLGVLGGINFAKGASVVRALAQQSPDCRVVIIGKVDPAFAMPSNVTVHGAYERSDIAMLAQKYGISRWLIPSVWPETFSFTTHEALATGLPVMAFAVGAQGQVVQKAEHGVALPFPTDQPFDASALANAVIDHLPQSAVGGL